MTDARVVTFAPRGLAGRLMATLVGIVLLVLAGFLFSVFLVVGAVLLVVGLIRVQWLRRRGRRVASTGAASKATRSRPDIIAVEYTVETDSDDAGPQA